MLSRYNVYSPLLPLWGIPQNGLQSTMNRLFQDFETAFARPASGASQRQEVPGSGPRVQLREQGDSISLLADLPGLRQGDIELGIEGQTVTLKATAPADPTPEGFTALRRERRPIALEWSFELPYAIDADLATASIEQGRLSVTLPKAREAKPRSIPVRAA